MIIKLPVCIEDKILFINFILEKTSEKNLLLKIFNRNYENKLQRMKVPLCNNFEGITYIDLFFPMQLEIIDNKILFNNFIQKIFLSQNNLAVDFFITLEKNIKSEFGYDFINKNDLNVLQKNIWNYWNNLDDSVLVSITNNHLETVKSLWDTAQRYLNFAVYLIYLHPTFTNKSIKEYQKKYNITKKIVNIANSIKLIKYTIYSSNDYSFNEHYNRLVTLDKDTLTEAAFKRPSLKSTLNELKIGYKYFIKSSEQNKFFQIEITNIKDGIIHTQNNQAFIFNNYEWYFYISNLEFDDDIIFFNLINNQKNYDELFEKTSLKIEPIHTKKLLEYYNNNNYECSLIYFRGLFDETYSDLEILKRNNYSDGFFQYVTSKYSSTKEDAVKVLKILFDNYTYPIKQNKIDRNFDHILYYSFYNLNKLFNKDSNYDKQFLDNSINDLIPIKVRNLYMNLVNLMNQIVVKNNFHFLISNQKFYNDYLHRVIIRLLFTKNKLLSSSFILSTLSNIQLERVKTIFQNSILCIDVVNRLNWSNLPKRLNYLDILYSNKDIIFFIDRLNKNIFPDNYDARLKKIIEQPNEMFKYLRKEKDIIKWLKFLGPSISTLFYTPISLSSDDILHLAKIIFLLTTIPEQNLKNDIYLKFINYSQKYNKLILDNTRINLKIKENFSFLKVNLNLGFLAKHLTYNQGESLNLDFDLEKTQDLIKVEEELRRITKKYYKYKTKYSQSKKVDATEYPLSETSIGTAKNKKIIKISQSSLDI